MLTRYWSLSQHCQLQPNSKSKAWQLSTQLKNKAYELLSIFILIVVRSKKLILGLTHTGSGVQRTERSLLAKSLTEQSQVIQWVSTDLYPTSTLFTDNGTFIY